MKKLLITAMMLCALVPMMAYGTREVIVQINPNKGFRAEANGYHFKAGGDKWFRASEVYRDEEGLFTYLSKVNQINDDGGNMMLWQCPYCDSWVVVGFACNNSKCPSNFHP